MAAGHGVSRPYTNIGKVRIRRQRVTGNIKGQIKQKIRRKYRIFGFGK